MSGGIVNLTISLGGKESEVECEVDYYSHGGYDSYHDGNTWQEGCYEEFVVNKITASVRTGWKEELSHNNKLVKRGVWETIDITTMMRMLYEDDLEDLVKRELIE